MIYSEQLLREILEYKPDINFRARVIQLKCIRHGHTNWADRIAKKYLTNEPKSDATVAFGWALLACKKEK